MYCQVPSQGCFSSVNIDKDLHHCCPQRENKHLTLQQSVLSFLFIITRWQRPFMAYHRVEENPWKRLFLPFLLHTGCKTRWAQNITVLGHSSHRIPSTNILRLWERRESTMVQVFLDIKSHCEVAYHYPWAPLAPDLSFFTGGGRIFSPIRMSAPSLLNTCPASSTFNSLLYPTIFNQLQYLSPSS